MIYMVLVGLWTLSPPQVILIIPRVEDHWVKPMKFPGGLLMEINFLRQSSLAIIFSRSFFKKCNYVFSAPIMHCWDSGTILFHFLSPSHCPKVIIQWILSMSILYQSISETFAPLKNNNLMGPGCMNVTLLFRAIISIALKKKKPPSLTGCILRALFQMSCSEKSDTWKKKKKTISCNSK